MDLWDAAYRTPGALGPHFGHYATLGDGLTQHGAEFPVTVPLAADYFASLARFILAPDRSLDDDRDILWAWPVAPEAALVKFALSVEFKTGPTRYFTLHNREYKISARAALAHDRRWHPIKESDTGGINTALRVMGADDRDHGFSWLIDRWVTYETVRKIGESSAPPFAREQLNADLFDERASLLHRAFNLASDAFSALQSRLDASFRLAHLIRDLQPPAADTSAQTAE
jgi:hypothetical protein